MTKRFFKGGGICRAEHPSTPLEAEPPRRSRGDR